MDRILQPLPTALLTHESWQRSFTIKQDPVGCSWLITVRSTMVSSKSMSNMFPCLVLYLHSSMESWLVHSAWQAFAGATDRMNDQQMRAPWSTCLKPCYLFRPVSIDSAIYARDVYIHHLRRHWRHCPGRGILGESLSSRW